MGIDAEMFVKLDRKVGDAELKRASYIFGSMFHNHLLLGMDEEIWHRPLEKVDKVEGDGEGPGYEFASTNSTSLIKVPLSGRYYGIGYERGPLMVYVQIAEFLETLFPDATIYYGGDSSGVAYEVFDKKNRDNLIKYAAQNGHDPYNKYFDKENDGPTCPVCDVKMIRNGWGANFANWSCIGCGWNHSEKDGEVIKGFRR